MPNGPWVTKAPSGRWKAGWRDLNGRQRYKTFDRRQDALRYLAERKVDKARGLSIDPTKGRIKVEDFWPRFLASPNLRPSTRAQYETLGRLYILPNFGGRKLEALTPLAIGEWVADLTRTRGISNARASYRIFRSMLGKAVAGEFIARNPAVGVNLPELERREMRCMNLWDLVHVATVVDERYTALIFLLGLAGLRIGEAVALRPEDLNLPKCQVRVTKSVAEVRGQLVPGPTKTGKVRSVPIPATLANTLAGHLARYPSYGGPVFTNPDGSMIRRSNFRRNVWIPALRRAVIPKPYPRLHDLRHTAVAIAIEQGAHPKQIQEMVGHSSISVTLDVYGHLLPGLGDQLSRRLDTALVAAQERVSSEPPPPEPVPLRRLPEDPASRQRAMGEAR